jgi:CDI immunity proteins
MKLIEADPTLAIRPNFGSGLSDRMLSLRQRQLASLTLGEIALCLRQSVALSHLVPLALTALAVQPLVEAELYPGDLLVSLLHAADRAVLSEHETNELYDICSNALVGADTIAESVVPAALAFVGRSNGS